MKKQTLFLLLISTALLLTSCSKDDQDDKPQGDEPGKSGVKSFVYEGLKLFYLYKSEDEVLADDYFANDEERDQYLETYSSPEDLFEDLLYEEDYFSIIVPDYRVLEGQLDGITLNEGMDFELRLIESSREIIGVVRYVMPNTSAAEQGVKRGMLFNRINGTALNEDNYLELLQEEKYELGLAEFKDEQLKSIDTTIELSKAEYSENPLHKDTTFTIDGHKIGYLMYNGFIRTFDDELNEVFGDFKSEHIDELVIDLRYNGGGSVETSRALASMITGQFEGDVFAKEVYNEHFDDEEIYFGKKIEKSGAEINSLNMNKVYVLASESTASASELIINGLEPYINVVQVGTNTVGKFQGSITLYDTKDFTRSNLTPGRDYAMQPLIMKLSNADDKSDYTEGLSPDIEYEENIFNFGTIGEPDEPLLKHAIDDITSTTNRKAFGEKERPQVYKTVGERKMNELSYQRMYKDPK